MDNEITLWLDGNRAIKLVDLCNSCEYDVNVLYGRRCVDGKSIEGVLAMCGRPVTIAPVGVDDIEYELFRRKVQALKE